VGRRRYRGVDAGNDKHKDGICGCAVNDNGSAALIVWQEVSGEDSAVVDEVEAHDKREDVGCAAVLQKRDHVVDNVPGALGL
jgi:hypothetical protein